ncbi:MAG: DUF3256 family protein [Muribaculaceae bacterium]
MKYLRISILAMALGMALACAARTAADFFVAMPESVLPLFNDTERQDMIDYYRYGSERRTPNNFGGTSRVVSESETVLTVSVAENSQMQVAVIASKSDTIVAVISTVSLPVQDARIDFYDRNWQPLRRQPVAMPEFTDWFTKDGEAHVADISLALDFIPMTISYDAEASTLTFHSNCEGLLAPEDAERLHQWLLQDIVYDIKGTKFRRRK